MHEGLGALLSQGSPHPLTLTAGPWGKGPSVCLCSSGGHVNRRRVLWKLIPKRQTASSSVDHMGSATPTLAFQHPTDTLF